MYVCGMQILKRSMLLAPSNCMLIKEMEEWVRRGRGSFNGEEQGVLMSGARIHIGQADLALLFCKMGVIIVVPRVILKDEAVSGTQ